MYFNSKQKHNTVKNNDLTYCLVFISKVDSRWNSGLVSAHIIG